jgi:endonuclease/exonuclease/phosphatase family metal-dependent hydrolase
MTNIPFGRTLGVTAFILTALALLLLSPAFLPRPLLAAPVASGGRTNAPATASRPTTTASARLRVATYNMNYGITDQNSFATYLQIIRKANPDVLAIQEGNPALFAFLKKELAKEYPHTQFHQAQFGGSLGWLSKLPLNKPTWVPKSFGLTGTAMVQIAFAGKTIQLVSVHLQPTNIPNNASVLQALASLRQADDIREKELRFIHAKLPQNTPTVVMGDFNGLASFRSVSFLTDSGFTDTFAAFTKDPDTHPTWTWPNGNGGEWRYRIDFIFTNPQLKPTASQILETKASDHFLLLTELDPQDKPATTTTAPSAPTPAPN